MADDRTLTMSLPNARTSFAVASLRTRTLLALIFAVALLPLLSAPVLPFIDLYNHLARYYVLANLPDNALLQRNYAANWLLLPNIGLDVVGTLLLRILPPAYAAHTVVIGIFAVQYGGVLTFNRVLTGRWSPFVALLLVPLLYSFILNWGFANFLMGLGLVFWAAAWWLAKRDRLVVALPVACLLAIMIFFCHGLTFALYGILLGTLEIGLFLQRPARRAVQLAAAMIPLAVQAAVPIVLFALAPVSGKVGGLTNADEAVARLSEAGMLSTRLWDLFCYRLLTIVRVAEGPSLSFDIATFAATGALLAFLFFAARLSVVRTVWPALGAGAILVAITPPALFGVGYVADRMPLFLALVFLGGLAVKPIMTPGQRNAVIALAGLIVLRLVMIGVDWRQYASDWREFETVAARVPPGAIISEVVVGGSPRNSGDRRCGMYRPLMITLYGAVGPLFSDPAAQPLRLIGPLRAAMTALPHGWAKGEPRPGYYDDLISNAGSSGFDYLFVCNADRLLRSSHAGAELVVKTPRFTLLKVSPRHSSATSRP